jgi:hypothetical protein
MHSTSPPFISADIRLAHRQDDARDSGKPILPWRQRILTFQLHQYHLQNGWYQIPAEDDQLRPAISTQTQEEVLSLPPQRLLCHNSRTLLQSLVAGRTTTVNASLVYSRGQLALAPCTDCWNQHQSHEKSAFPFPECVILPARYGFACANCIIRGRSAECSFYARSIKDQNKWKMHLMDVGDMGSPDLNWFRRGHPLSQVTNNRRRIWTLESTSDCEVAHDLTDPAQEPAFVFPPDIPNAIVPLRFRPQESGGTPDPATDAQPAAPTNRSSPQLPGPNQGDTAARATQCSSAESRPKRTIRPTRKVIEGRSWDPVPAKAGTGRQRLQGKRRTRRPRREADRCVRIRRT